MPSAAPLALGATTHGSQQFRNSSDHLVGDREQPWWHLEAERSRRLKVDGEFEFSGLNHQQLGGLRTLEDAAGRRWRCGARLFDGLCLWQNDK